MDAHEGPSFVAAAAATTFGDVSSSSSSFAAAAAATLVAVAAAAIILHLARRKPGTRGECSSSGSSTIDCHGQPPAVSVAAAFARILSSTLLNALSCGAAGKLLWRPRKTCARTWLNASLNEAAHALEGAAGALRSATTVAGAPTADAASFSVEDALRDGRGVAALHGLLFPCVLDVVSQRSFPFPLLGSVHMACEAVQLESINLGAGQPPRGDLLHGRATSSQQLFDVCVWYDLDRGSRPHKRGTEVDVITALYALELDGQNRVRATTRAAPLTDAACCNDAALFFDVRPPGAPPGTSVFGKRLVWASRNTFLFFHSTKQSSLTGTHAKPAAAAAPTSGASEQPHPHAQPVTPARGSLKSAPVASFQLPANFGRIWAAVCKDYNPIHMCVRFNR